jgi:hypothetical protein
LTGLIGEARELGPLVSRRRSGKIRRRYHGNFTTPARHAKAQDFANAAKLCIRRHKIP